MGSLMRDEEAEHELEQPTSGFHVYSQGPSQTFQPSGHGLQVRSGPMSVSPEVERRQQWIEPAELAHAMQLSSPLQGKEKNRHDMMQVGGAVATSQALIRFATGSSE